MDLGGPAGSHLLLKVWKDKIMAEVMSTAWILFILVLNQWTQGPAEFKSEQVCEQAFKLMAKTFKEEKLTPPDHKCVEVTHL